MRPGILLALLSAVAFGLATPVIARAGAGLSPFLVAALLYFGAAIAAIVLKLVTRRQGSPLQRAHGPRLLAAGVVGAAIAPTLLTWGLERTGGVVGSLLLCGEPVFTALLAWRLFREPVGARFGLALGLMVVAGALLVVPTTRHALPLFGALAIVGATIAWAIDNSISRALGDEDPLSIVAVKGLIGATITGVIAHTMPPLRPALELLAVGAVGYGLSLRLYLDAQRRIGAGRTASVFATAPFVGALFGLALGERAPVQRTLVAGALFAFGVYLHLTERHAHRHRHHALDHEHPHRHDDGHHEHTHDPPVIGEHSHAHHHDVVEHDHEHAPDLHHTHRH